MSCYSRTGSTSTTCRSGGDEASVWPGKLTSDQVPIQRRGINVSHTATTKEGFSYSGIITQESDTSITLTLPDGKQHALLRSEIEELEGSGKSLMPEGLENELTEQDVADLLTLLSGSPDVR